jgi:hypothetical protein
MPRPPSEITGSSIQIAVRVTSSLKNEFRNLGGAFGYANFSPNPSTIGKTMKLSLPQMQTLKRLTNGPRSSISFTTTETYSPGSYHSPTHLKNLEMNGFVVEIGEMWHLTNQVG